MIARQALAALAAFALWGAALAADCPFPVADPPAGAASTTATLMRLRQADCLGDSTRDPAPVVADFNRLTEQPIALGQEERLLQAVALLRDFAGSRGARGANVDTWKSLELELADVHRKLAALPDAASMVQFQHVVNGAITGQWEAVSQDDPADVQIRLAGTTVRPLVAPACAALAPCPAFGSTLDVVRVANLMARLRRYAQSETLARHLADARLATARWESYRTQGHHQYIWEVWLNGKRMGEDLCPRDAGTGMRMGFCKVPNSQLVVLHPDAGLRWTKSASSSAELAPALIVELLGFYRWDWKSAESAQMTNRRGISFAAAYTDVGFEKRWSYGPMFHYEGYNLAITKAGGGHWGVMINLNLAERYFGRKQEYVDELRRIRKSGLGELLLGAKETP